MKLLSCHVEHFGKLSEYDRSFVPGVNTILEKNGWGKSTLAAFLRVMFFGFDNEGKHDALKNERQRFRPWGGGSYGGSVCFEAHGRQYRMERVFGEKRSADTFRLFTLPDGLPSSDYAENAGEALFGLDADSFERTVFLDREDAETFITPGITARIGNLSEETADMGNYEEAQARLKRETDRLTPDRKTGELSRLVFQTAALREQVRPRELLLREAEEERREMELLLKKKAEQLCEEKALREEVRRRGAAGDFEADRAVYEAIRKRVRSAKAKEMSLRAAFPGEVPDRERLEQALETARSLDGLSRDVLSARLSADETELLRRYREKYGERADASVKGAGRELSSGRISKRLPLILFAAGALLAGAGMFLMRTAPGNGGSLAAAAGAVSCAAALLLLFRRGREGENRTAAGRGADAPAAAWRRGEAEKIRESYERREYRQLAEKYARLKEAGERLNRAAEEVNASLAFFHVQSRGIQSAVSDLSGLRERLTELEEAGRRRKEAEEEERTFEKTRGAERCAALKRAAAETETAPPLEVLSERAERLREASGKTAEQIAALRGRMEKTEKALEHTEDAAQKLSEALFRQETLKRRYTVLCRTREFLSRARASFSEKYMEQILGAFERFYSLAAGQDGKEYRLDASLNLIPVEQGASREMETQSSGYRALVGICRRMALIEAMYRRERPFLILDDPFALLDGEKLAGAMKLLRTAEEEGYQILYFTCHESRTPGAEGRDNWK